MTTLQALEQLNLSIDDRGFLCGKSASGVLPNDVRVRFAGTDWATIPSRPIEGSAGRSFRCALPSPPPGGAAPSTASVLDLFGDVLASIDVPARAPVVNSHGLLAADVLALHDWPFFGIPYMSFDGSRITISGSHLPPGGDPSALGVAFGPGVAYEFRYPMESPSWENHFWYWPNALFSDFTLTIDLGASAAGSDPFTFRFTYEKGAQKLQPEPYGRVWIPRDLGSAIGFPVDPSQLTRVQTWSDNRTVTLTGFNAFCSLKALLDRYGIRGAPGTTVMDWGCGHGRVARHFIREWPRTKIIGMDIDAENIAWASRHLPGGKFVLSPLMPPSPLATGSIDAAFSISVMTHLPLDVQREWLRELARVVCSDGIVFMTFGGPGAVAWSSVWNGPAYLQKLLRDGIHADQVDTALDGKIEVADYYRNCAQTHAHVREHWSEYFDIIEIISDAIGNLDVAVMRPRKNAAMRPPIKRPLSY